MPTPTHTHTHTHTNSIFSNKLTIWSFNSTTQSCGRKSQSSSIKTQFDYRYTTTLFNESHNCIDLHGNQASPSWRHGWEVPRDSCKQVARQLLLQLKIWSLTVITSGMWLALLMSPTLIGVLCYNASNTVMWSKNATEQRSISRLPHIQLVAFLSSYTRFYDESDGENLQTVIWLPMVILYVLIYSCHMHDDACNPGSNPYK